jgi:hypothetical protein
MRDDRLPPPEMIALNIAVVALTRPKPTVHGSDPHGKTATIGQDADGDRVPRQARTTKGDDGNDIWTG